MNTTTDYDVTTQIIFTTTTDPGSHQNIIRGFIACSVAVLFFGSNFLPVKTCNVGDGLFFQWVMCSTIFLAGLIVQCVQGFPTFYPLAMLGGFLFTTGNVLCVPIIQTLGLTQGLLIWASVNLLTGWVTGRFGLLGLNKEVPKDVTMNYIGMALCLVSAFIYACIKSNPGNPSNPSNSQSADDADEDSPLIPRHSILHTSVNTSVVDAEESTNVLDKLPQRLRRICAIGLAIIAGLMFGVNFAPVIYIQNNYVHNNVTASQNGLDYVFAHFSGLYTTSTLYFFIYCAVMRNQPRIYPRIILPAALSGLMWSIADIAFFMANADLSEAVSFPIVSSGPGIIAAIWGVLIFKEITGRRNLLLLLGAFALAVAGAVLTGLSLT